MTNGITISQEGISVDRALDSQKVLDSRWRYLEIAFEKELVLPSGMTDASGKTVDVFQHNLGFLPAFDCYDVTTGAYINDRGSGAIQSDENKIFLSTNGGSFLSPLSNHKVMLRIYNVSIFQEYEALIKQTLPTASSFVNKTGIKVSDGSSDFDTSELRRFPLTTSAKALAIQKTGTTVFKGVHATISHGLGSPPIFLSTIADSKGRTVNGIDPSFCPFVVLATGDMLRFTPVQSSYDGTTLAYVIFKEFGETVI